MNVCHPKPNGIYYSRKLHADRTEKKYKGSRSEKKGSHVPTVAATRLDRVTSGLWAPRATSCAMLLLNLEQKNAAILQLVTQYIRPFFYL